MGLFDKFFKDKRADIELRFVRIRSSVSGTMSNFYVAKDHDRNDQIVGVKLCDPEKVEFFESRFKGLNKPSEGEIAVAMKHPNIVSTFEYGMSTKGLPYLVMEFIDGPGLQQLIQNRAENLLKGHRISLIRQMADALNYVHRVGYIHRDICPRNFICSQDMTMVKLIDFGLSVPAKKEFMQPGNRTGTPLYMAPEVVRRRATDQRLDIFSFGVTCYQLVCFEHPWPGTETSGLAALNHDTSPPADILKFRPDTPPLLASAIMQALQANPTQRTPDMDSFIKQIKPVKADDF
jgi:eukaryotic-like serine/threonine-protein kinase